eukprot:151319_1
MSYLFPLQYVYAGNVLIGIICLIALQQLCWSPVASNESPSIKSKVLTCSFCFATYVLNWLLILHYSSTHSQHAVTTVRLFICFTLLLGAITTFKFVTSSMDALYKSKKNQQSSPGWFVLMWKLSMSCVVSSVSLGSFLAYWYHNAIFFHLYYLVIDIIILIACLAIIFAMLELRNRIKQIVQNTVKLSEYPGSITSRTTLHHYAKQSRKLKRKKCKFDLIIVVVMLGLIINIIDFYSSVSNIDFNVQISLYKSPYPTLNAYLSHLVFTLAFDGVLVLWIYKPSRCCKKHRATKPNKEDSKHYIPASKSAKIESSKPLEIESASTTTEHNLIVLYLCCPCLDCEDNNAWVQQFEQRLLDPGAQQNPFVERRKNAIKPTTEMENTDNKETTPPTPMTPMTNANSELDIDNKLDVIQLALYNFENLLFLAPNMIFSMNVNDVFDFEYLCELFGGVHRVRGLGKHFTFVSQKNIKLCIMSNVLPRKDIKSILTTLHLVQKFDEIIGIDHVVCAKNPQCSLNEKLLKLTDTFDGISPHNILYIDSDVNTYNVERSNICNVFGVNTLQPLSNADILNIQKKLS